MKKYQIITYDVNCGADEKLEYSTLKEANTVAQNYMKDTYKGVVIYNLLTHKIIKVYGFIPTSAIPVKYS